MSGKRDEVLLSSEKIATEMYSQTRIVLNQI